MSLTDFSIYPPATVILDDGRDADQSWRNHEARYPAESNRGGVDVVAPVGTPVYAWADGIVERQENNGSAGNVARLHLAHDPGWKLDYKHLSGYADLVNGVAKKGQLIGYSGRSGGVAPHVHYNLVDPSGTRQNPWHYVSGAASAASITPQEEEPMSVIVYDKARTDSAAFVLDINDPTRPLSRATGAEFQAATKAGAAVVALESADFQALLRSRGLFVQDGAQRITPYSAAAVATLSPVQKQYSINHGGFLAVRAAG